MQQMSNKMNHGSVFTGIGGFDLAAETAGFNNIFQVEKDEHCLKVLEKNFPTVEKYKDIRDFNGEKYRGTIDIISGGFPCQDISISKGKDALGIKGENSGLWKEYKRIIREIRPELVLFENSSMLLRRGFEYVLCDLFELGYYAEWRCFYASQFGYPHLRKRVFGVAYANGERWKVCLEQGGILQKILPERISGQNALSMPVKRFNSGSDFSSVRMYDGFSRELDQDRIKGLGNAIIPDIAYKIFMQLKELNSK